jgi:L-galactono-1,4-lactone dehydrogenase
MNQYLKCFHKSNVKYIVSIIVGSSVTLSSGTSPDNNFGVAYESEQTHSNWSETHTCTFNKVYEPKNDLQLMRVLKLHNDSKKKIRPIGTMLSPNGLSMSHKNNALSLHNFDSVVVDPINNLVTVGAGATVSKVLKELSKFNLTLESFSSIQDQQVGGWTQVAAHGTGCTLPTVEEQIVEMKLATVSEGIITLSETKYPYLFRMAKVGLGCLGVVTELTLKCIPKHTLHENTTIFNKNSIEPMHNQRLQDFRHVRYMWIPYTDTVVSVTSNMVAPTQTADISSHEKLMEAKPSTKSFTDLALKLNPNLSLAYLDTLGFGQLRDILLDIAPLDVKVCIVNSM